MKIICLGKDLIILAISLLISNIAVAQTLTSGSASFTEKTNYPVFSPNDNIYYFCGAEGQQNGQLIAQSGGEVVTFLWEKFVPASATFTFYANETASKSTQSSLADGCYRVRFTENGKDFQFRAWVFNGWVNSNASITESTCKYFKLQATATSANYSYFDISTGQQVVVNQSYNYTWYLGTTIIATIASPVVNNPPAVNTKYKVEVTDRAGCMKSAEVEYISIVPKAKFTWTTTQKADPNYTNPQAPAEIDFKNESTNADHGKYEWYLFKDKAIIDSNSAGGLQIDSIKDILYDDNPIYNYENSGRYMVKLVAAKETANLTCRDTFYLKDYIVVDTSLVKVAPVFTPNGDGINDELVIKARSLQSLDFQIFNRWGKKVHSYKKDGFMPENAEMATWDGKIGGKVVPAGVYFYVVDAQGRDGVRRRTHGFFELIW